MSLARRVPAVGAMGVGAALMCGCASVGTRAAVEPAPSVAAADSLWVRDELFVGFDIQGGAQVSDAEFEAFLEREVTPRFPGGYSALNTVGRYQYGNGEIVREPGRILIFLHPPRPEDEASIVAIAEAYKKAFRQEAVLRVRSSAGIRLYD